MSVYTPLTSSELDWLLNWYTFGPLTRFEGINDGIENTNYVVTTQCGDFVLTIFEFLSATQLTIYLDLLAHLNRAGIPCPVAQYDNRGNRIHLLRQKPAALFTRLPGTAVLSPSTAQCQSIGRQLARLHLNSRDYLFPRENSYDLTGCKKIFERIVYKLPHQDVWLLEDELEFQTALPLAKLPRGVIHGDLFRDNVLFLGGSVSAILDFYSACSDTLLLDLAITVNDWCSEKGTLSLDKTAALIAGYESLRPLLEQEQHYWNAILRAAALRFWLSRLQHRLYPRPGEITLQKDPEDFRRLLLQHRSSENETIPASSNAV
ncbi:MAG: homoserine kinase [Gammaproteobacteria bacterium]